MAVSIDQRPLYEVLPIGQQIIFAVSENTIVATKFKVKFIAEVHVSTENINLTNSIPIGTFKTTPNNAGVGIFDLRPILETFVKADNEGSTHGNGSRYKESEVTHPMHLIDKFAVSENAIRFFAIQFKIEFSDTDGGAIIAPDETGNTNNAANTVQYIFFNGVLPYDYPLTLEDGNYGYNLEGNYWYLSKSGGGKFLTNAPAGVFTTHAKARLTDYGTLPFLDWLPDPNIDQVLKFEFFYYYEGVLQDSEDLNYDWINGGITNFSKYVYPYLAYFGAFPANLRGWSTKFQALITAGTIDSYFIRPHNVEGGAPSYYIDIICPNDEGHNRGFEMIRLTWLNQWGTWDYYTFTMKSTRSVTTKRIPYQQQGGTWNESRFKIKGWKGGKKNFRVNSTEKIKINTDFVSEAEGVWFEELINSQDVYIVNEYVAGDDTATITNKYIEPVTLTTSSYVKKTIANDKLMQYTFEIEKSKMKRTQAV
tara:strand:+ start:11 stop:1447 length:1437 start_codon:yes stop_codon:yes gene_type:complete